ncbi:unnamed protein product [Blepharisma stoltei]|uniref:Uncharacterized protein n=1 Tax=Blepharisma stoltei TaxID=1481888 RepID=A0AAU9IG14_9CILI|nr:unnamed protein product [Blepharisma stoltei]
MYFVMSLMAVQTIGPVVNSIREIYYVAKRSMNKEIYPEEKIPNEKRGIINAFTVASEEPSKINCRKNFKNGIRIEAK